MSESARPRSPSAATPTIGLNDVQLRQVFVDLESEGLRSPKVIARGGTSIVISAFDSALAATVAVKVLFREPSAALAEARLLASVPSHNSIIEIHRMGLLSEGWPYLVLELCPAGSLAGYLRDRGPLSPGLAIAVVRAVAQAVQQLHGLETPVLHLDIKPANLLITRWGGIKLSDFGSSSARGAPRAAAFSPTHAAPEQILGDEVGPFTDLYSIASLLYELIAGVPPYGDLPPEELAEIKVSASSPSLDSPRIPDELRHFLTVYLDRDPRNRRPATASGFERELAAVARRLRLETVPPRLTVLDEADIVDDLTVELSGPMQPISPRVGTQPNWATPPRLGDPGSASPPDRSVPPSETPANDMRRFDPPGRTPPDPSSADDRPPSASTTTDLGHLGGPAHLPVLGIDAEDTPLRQRRVDRDRRERWAMAVAAIIAVGGAIAFIAHQLSGPGVTAQISAALARPMTDPLIVSGKEQAPRLDTEGASRIAISAQSSQNPWIIQVSEWEVDPLTRVPGERPISVRALPTDGEESTTTPDDVRVVTETQLNATLSVRPDVVTCFAVQVLADGDETDAPGAPACTPLDPPVKRTLGTELDEDRAPSDDESADFAGTITVAATPEGEVAEGNVQRDVLIEWDGDRISAVEELTRDRIEVSGPKDRCWSVVSGNALAPLPALAIGEVPDLSKAVRSQRLCPWLGR